MKKDLNLKVCIWNYGDYNKGITSWKWFNIEDYYDIEGYINELQENTSTEEYYICDYECNYELPINENTCIYDLIEMYKNWDEIFQAAYEEANIFDIHSFDEIFSGYAPLDIANKIHFGNYNSSDDYFTFDGYENIKTINEFELNDYLGSYIYDEVLQYI